MSKRFVIWVTVDGWEVFYKAYDSYEQAREELEGIKTVRGITKARLWDSFLG